MLIIYNISVITDFIQHSNKALNYPGLLINQKLTGLHNALKMYKQHLLVSLGILTTNKQTTLCTN